LDNLRIRSTIGASVVAIIRDASLVANPDGQAHLHTGDLVAVLGTREQIERFRQAMSAVTPAA
jgi:K+/H+ antiporter YhaU regulatory subunit KhtT